jgi:hypothetical protein
MHSYVNKGVENALFSFYRCTKFYFTNVQNKVWCSYVPIFVGHKVEQMECPTSAYSNWRPAGHIRPQTTNNQAREIIC